MKHTRRHCIHSKSGGRGRYGSMCGAARGSGYWSVSGSQGLRSSWSGSKTKAYSNSQGQNESSSGGYDDP